MRAAATALILVIVLYYAVHSRFRLWCTIEVLQTKVFTRKQPANQSPVANFGDSGFVHHKERPNQQSAEVKKNCRQFAKSAGIC